MARAAAASLRGLVGVAAAGQRRVSATGLGRGLGPRAPPGGRGFRAVASGSGGRTTPGSSSSLSSSARPQLQPRRGAAAGRTLPRTEAAGWVSGGFVSEDGKLSCGYSSFKGRRPTMEDCYDIKFTKINGQSVSLFGVFDGHGGTLAAEYLKEHLFENLMKHPQFLTDTKLAIRRTFLKTDADLLESVSNPFRDDGSTALTAVLVGKHLYVANVGDSRAVVSKSGKAVPVSNDQKPNRKDEQKRIENAGGVIIYDGTFRVGGILAMSRAFGNRLLKQYVIAEPEIQEEEVNSDLEYLVLATDGLWDVVRNEDAISLLKAEDAPEAAAVKLMEVAHSRLSSDNITCIVVQFHHGIGYQYRL